MKSEALDNIVFLTIILGRNQKDDLLEALQKESVNLSSVIFVRGTVNASYLTNILGLVPEEHKACITCVTTREKSDSVMKMLIEKFHFNKPNTGIAFTVPLERMTF